MLGLSGRRDIWGSFRFGKSRQPVRVAGGVAVFGLSLTGSYNAYVYSQGDGGYGISTDGTTNAKVTANGDGRVYTYSVYPKVVGAFDNDFVRGRYDNIEISGRFVTQNISGRF